MAGVWRWGPYPYRHESAFRCPRDHYRIVAIRRVAQTIIPRGSDQILEGDIVYFITTSDYVEQVREVAGKEDIKVRDLIIMGASKITEQTCNMLPSNVSAKILEKDKVLADKLCKVTNRMIVNSDASDPNMLAEEDIEDMDAFVALSSKTESNILACLEAKRHGIKNVARIPINPAIAATCDAGMIEFYDTPWLEDFAEGIKKALPVK